MTPQKLLKIVSEKKSVGLKLLYVGMGTSAKDNFYVRCIPSANLIDLNEFTETQGSNSL